MKKELGDELYEAFPKLFRPLDSKSREPFERYGFEINDGWFTIVKDMAERLAVFDGVYVTQIKEKLGLLRIYLSHTTDETLAIVNEAVDRSVSTCEVCGNPGKLESPRGWVKCVCSGCLWKWTSGA